MSDFVRIITQASMDNQILALRAAKSLLNSTHKDCLYQYENGVKIWAYRTKSGVSAREIV